MRLFTAIDLPPEILLRLERLLVALRPEALIKWSPLDNLHITTKFIGEWPESRLEELNGVLGTIAPRSPFNVELRELGWFPNARSPHVLWLGVQGGKELLELVTDMENRLEHLGIKKENRAFSPHITLARIKNPVPLRRLRQKLEELQPAALGRFVVTEFFLYRSDPGSNSSIYRRLRGYRFQAAMAAS